jgi:two-component system NtrC family sensor kinase
LVNDLLTYARPRPAERRPTDLAAVLDGVIALAKPAADAANVNVRMDAAGGLPPVMADPEQMRQLFDNLVLNAIQAMPNGGTLTIRGGGHAPSGAWARNELGPGVGGRGTTREESQPIPAGKWVTIAVEDTGSGIPEADLPRIFEPFFTTRTKGTGLGLAICRQIVEAHGGTIRVAWTGPAGTGIEVTLPREAPTHG